MKNWYLVVFLTSFLALPSKELYSTNLIDSLETLKMKGSYFTGVYENLFSELLGKNDSVVQTRVESSFHQLFYGDDYTQRLYYPVDPDMAYIEDVFNHDVRTEGMSYGMMIAVQLNKKSEFDRLWKWSKTYMQHKDGPRKYYFAWHCSTDGTMRSMNPASDGEEWFVMSLFFASARWGDGDGMYNYKAEAQCILDAMLTNEFASDKDDEITPMFNKTERQVVFVPFGKSSTFTDPSYHLPHFYELWSRWANKNNSFWCDAASTSRQFLKKTVHPKTGLAPDYAHFDGSPIDPWRGGNKNFLFDAWRVAMNVALDYEWLAKDDWAIEQSNRLLDFFYAEGIGKYGNSYTLDGKKLSDDHSVGLAAMNAVAALASTNDNRKEFVEELWNTPVPDGPYRYYDGMLYMLAMLQVSGNFRIYDSTSQPVPDCSKR